MKARTTYDYIPRKLKYAVGFKGDFDLNYGGDVDFLESDFTIDSVQNFFSNPEFMAKIQNVLNILADHEDDPNFQTFMNGINHPEELENFFDWTEENEIYSTGIFNAMSEETYNDYMDEAEDEDEDW